MTHMKKIKYIGIHFIINKQPMFPEALTHGEKECLQTVRFSPVRIIIFFKLVHKFHEVPTSSFGEEFNIFILNLPVGHLFHCHKCLREIIGCFSSWLLAGTSVRLDLVYSHRSPLLHGGRLMCAPVPRWKWALEGVRRWGGQVRTRKT